MTFSERTTSHHDIQVPDQDRDGEPLTGFLEAVTINECGLGEGMGLPEDQRGEIERRGKLALTAAFNVLGINPEDITGREQYTSSNYPYLGTGVNLVVAPGFARIAGYWSDDPVSGEVNGALQRLRDALPPDRLSYRFGNEEVTLQHLAFLSYGPGAQVSSAEPDADLRQDFARYGFPADRGGHRDNLPDGSLLISEQLSGDPSHWVIINTIGKKFHLSQGIGDQVAMRGELPGLTEGRPWHVAMNPSPNPRTSILLGYFRARN